MLVRSRPFHGIVRLRHEQSVDVSRKNAVPRVLLLVIASASLAETATSQLPPERGGVELGLSLSWFPEWTVTTHYPDGASEVSQFQRQALWGGTLAVFPVRYIGIRGRFETSGIRYYSEDSGFDIWRLGLEGRFVRFGPATAFAAVEYGKLSQTYGIHMNFWSTGGGFFLRLSDAFVFTLSAELLWCSDAWMQNAMGRQTEIDLEPFGQRLAISWRPLRFSF